MGRFGWAEWVGVGMGLLLGACGQPEVERTWSEPERVSDDQGSYAFDPSAAAHPRGVHLVWLQGGSDDLSVRARHFDTRPSRWGETSDLGPATGEPAVAADSAGNAVVVWQSDGEVEGSIRTARYDSETDRWSEPDLLDEGGVTPHVAMGADGNALVVWTHRADDDWQLYAAHMTPDGAWSRGQPIDAATKVESLWTGVVLHGDGDATAFFSQINEENSDWARQLMVVRYTSDQDEWTRPVALQRIEDFGGLEVSLAGNVQGDAVLFWSLASDVGPAISTAAYDSSSDAWTEPDSSTAIGACHGTVALDNDGRATVACYYRKRGLSEVNAIRLGDDHAFGAIENVVSEQVNAVSMPAVLAVEGGALAVWSEGKDLDTTTMHSVSFRDGSWQAPEVVGKTSGGVPRPGLVGVPDRGVLAYWSTLHEIVTSWRP